MKMGYYEIAEKYRNVEIVNLSVIKRVNVQLDVGNKQYDLELPELFFDEIDFSISCPVPKVHCMTKLTLSLKNQWGCLPDTLRLKNHYVFDDIIFQVCSKLKFRYAFLDGKYGLDINGPMAGKPVELNWFAASNSLGAFDMVISGMMGFDWKKIGHMKNAEKAGYMPLTGVIDVKGDLNSMKRKFKLKRNFWNYPALAAFHSQKLTYLFYLSGWSKLLHDIMYSIRKRPISD
jgi:uncharacterized protein (DUF362 family)